MNPLYRTEGQWAVWTAFLAAGAAAGALGDWIAALARRMEGGKALESAAAFASGAAAAVIGAAVCLRSSGGAPRAYMAAALAIGALLYRCTLGRLLRVVRRWLTRLAAAVRRRVREDPLLQRLRR